MIFPIISILKITYAIVVTNKTNKIAYDTCSEEDNPIIDYINSSPIAKTLVHIDDVFV